MVSWALPTAPPTRRAPSSPRTTRRTSSGPMASSSVGRRRSAPSATPLPRSYGFQGRPPGAPLLFSSKAPAGASFVLSGRPPGPGLVLSGVRVRRCYSEPADAQAAAALGRRRGDLPGLGGDAGRAVAARPVAAELPAPRHHQPAGSRGAG